MTIVRRATETDIPRILELYQQLAPDSSGQEPAKAPELSQKMFREITEMEGYHLLVAEVNGEVVGTTVLAILPVLAPGVCRWGVVEFMVVDEACRRQGIGRTLMNHATGMAQAAGCYKVMLGSNKERPDAHRFYRSAGYEATHEGFTRYFDQA
jgi:GNAT superfamily N-acetyltransferase